MVTLRPVNLQWVNGAADDPADFCAHGDVEFRVGDDALIEPAGRGWPVVWPAWRAAVFDFADRVADFYAGCSPKRPAADDAAGFAKFVAEWERRRGGPTGLTERRTTGRPTNDLD